MSADAAALRADHAARRHETEAVHGPTMSRAAHERSASLFRRAERAHRETAAIFRKRALRCLAELDAGDAPMAQDVALMQAVAEVAGCAGAAARVRGGTGAHVTFASTPKAAAAAELEVTLAQGPGLEAADGPICAAEPMLGRRWPRLGRELSALGFATVAAAPISASDVPLGELLLLDEQPRSFDLLTVTALAESLLEILMTAMSAVSTRAYAGPDLDFTPQQAAGMLAANADCTVDDAMAMLRARSFASGASLSRVSESVLTGDWLPID